MKTELAGQTVVVIGGTSGIGLETARLARAEGADVILAARDPDRLKRVAAELSARGHPTAAGEPVGRQSAQHRKFSNP